MHPQFYNPSASRVVVILYLLKVGMIIVIIRECFRRSRGFSEVAFTAAFFAKSLQDKKTFGGSLSELSLVERIYCLITSRQVEPVRSRQSPLYFGKCWTFEQKLVGTPDVQAPSQASPSRSSLRPLLQYVPQYPPLAQAAFRSYKKVNLRPHFLGLPEFNRTYTPRFLQIPAS